VSAEPVSPNGESAGDALDRKAREERERLEQELSGGAAAPAPITEVDEDARRLAEQTRAEINGEDLGDLRLPEPELPEIELPSSSVSPEPPARSMPWESPQPEAALPLPQPASESEPQVEVSPDHVPAYAGLEEEKVMTPPISSPSSPPATRAQSQLPEPADVLWAIADVPSNDVIEPAQAPARHVVQATRAVAAESRASRRGRGQKPKFEELPFGSLIPHKPLIISFFSPAGGVGKSSASLNAAALIAAIGARQAANADRQGAPMRVPRVLAFDGDIVAGSLALLLTGEVKPNMHNLQLYLDSRAGKLGIDPAATPDEWQERYRERWPRTFELGESPTDEEPMKKFVHWPERLDNLNLLAAPDDPSKYHDFAAWEYEELLDICSQFYDVIVIDCGTEQVMESNQTWLRNSHSVFMMVTPALDRIWNSSKAMTFIARRRRDPSDHSDNPRMLEPLVTRDRVSIVMTSADMETGINLTGEELVGEFFPYIDEKQRFYIPDVRDELLKANNAHEFLVLDDARFAKSIMAIVKHSFNRYAFATHGGLNVGGN
jgi:MinD-like ATPase involved in chromosome partitioning or flagellar assembly